MKPIWAGLACALVACGSGDVTSSSTTATTVATTTTVATVPSTTTTTSMVTTTLAVTTTQVSDTTTTTASRDLPGEPIDIGPGGDSLAVIGVRYDDVLNLRAAPGADQAILDEIPPLYDGLITTGEGWSLPRSVWIAVDYEGTEGWVNMRYTGYLGEKQEGSPELMEGISGADMVELGMTVAEAFGYDGADIVVVAAPTAANPVEVTLDLLGLEDDSLRGQRAHIIGERVDGRFSVDSLETTAICARGVDGNGFCV